MHKVVLLRHGESTWNKENRFTGWTDVDLSETGREEAARAAPAPGMPPADFKIPQMGWNTVMQRKPACPLFAGLPDGAYFYFVHSFAPEDTGDDVIGVSEHGRPFAAVAARDNVFATQFHPEKSQSVGLTMLRNFAALR